MSGWTVTRMASRRHPIYKIVENDTYGQYPFVYAIEALDKFILIDAGTGQHNLRACVSQLNTRNLPYLLIITHCHFDHIGGVNQFVDSPDCLGVYISAANKVFTQNFELNSLAMAHHGARVNGFRVTRWLEDNSVIYLDESDKDNILKQIHCIWTPGHTPDSAAFWFPAEARLFIGDTLYPFTAVHLDCIGSNVNDYLQSLRKIQQFVQQKQQELSAESNSAVPAVVAAPSTNTSVSQYEPAMEQFAAVLGLQRAEIERQFSLESLLEICDGSAESAIELYLSNMDGIGQMCPPKSRNAPTVAITVEQGAQVAANRIMLSAGHVEENLDSSSIEKAIDMLTFIQAGAVAPQHVDGEYGEFCVENFTLMMPVKPKWQ